jgi:comEA protein
LRFSVNDRNFASQNRTIPPKEGMVIKMKNNLPFIITMSVFFIACAVLTFYTVRNEPQYVHFITNAPSQTQSPNSGQGAQSGNPDLVNINTAALEELQTLPNIGESRAAAIIAYREEFGAFLYTEEIMEISGIGEKIFEGLKDLICV